MIPACLQGTRGRADQESRWVRLLRPSRWCRQRSRGETWRLGEKRLGVVLLCQEAGLQCISGE